MNGDKAQRPFVLASIMLAMFMVAIEATIVATAMPAIVGKLGGFSLYSWVFSGFLLTQAATTVLYGKLSDLYGRRPILIVGVVLFLAGSTLCGLAWSMPSLIAFRLLQGLGAGAIQPVAMTIIGDLYTPEERGSIQGYLSSVWGISAILGPLAGGVIVERWSWPWVFWINLPVGVATIVGLQRHLHEGVEHKKHSIDFTGAGIFMTSMSCLLVALTMIGESSRFDLLTILFLVTFAATVPIFIWQERRAKEPMLDISLWTDRLMASANAASLCAGMTLIGITGFLAVYVQGVMGRSPTVAGLALTMMAVGWPIASMLSRRAYSLIGLRGTLRLGTLLIVIGSAMLLLLAPQSSPALAGLGSGITGFGMGFLVATCIILIQGSVPWTKRGSATASNVFARTLGNTIGAAVFGSILNFGLRAKGVSPDEVRALLTAGAGANTQLAQALHHGLHLTFWGVGVVAVLTAALAHLIPERQMHELTG